MSLTTAGTLKVLIEAGGLGLAAYRDSAPDPAAGVPPARPYVTIAEGISIVPERHGDQGDPDADEAVTELVQVDLWQRLKGSTTYDGRATDADEDPTLIRRLTRLLHGAQPGAIAPTITYGITVDDAVRLVERDRGVIHHAITVRVRRALDLWSI